MKNDCITSDDKNITMMKESNHRIKITLYENSILYVPNYWIVYYEMPLLNEEDKNNDDASDNPQVDTNDIIVEQIHYVPLVNKLNYLYKNVMSKKKEI